jgi:hypothetical protein
MGVFEGITKPFFINTDEGVVRSNSNTLITTLFLGECHA